VDSTTVLLNEAAVRELGWTDPVGRTLEANSETPQEVVGVVRDFHHRSLRGSIEPAVFMPVANHWHQQVVVVRFQAGQTREALAAVEGAWARFAPDHPLQHAFLDERFATLYDTERKLAALFAAFGGLAVLVACLGLFGLAAYTAERRRKEVGIRKALGATVSGLVALLAKDFMKPVAVSAVLAAPVAYLAMQRWLEGFASRAPLGPTPFLVAGGLALALALIAVAGQALRAASTDPVKALRSE
ncbi:MAG TPA: FtsX-like permease family protein, partial [Rhodothermales bacterium]|nr:FtsX-like permease family protein [Rhodothermales bacterium]